MELGKMDVGDEQMLVDVKHYLNCTWRTIGRYVYYLCHVTSVADSFNVYLINIIKFISS